MLETSTSPRRTGILDPVERFAGAVSVVIRPLGPQTRFVLRLAAEDAAMLGHLAGLQLAVPINRASRAEGRIAARLGPDERLPLAPEADALVFRPRGRCSPPHHAGRDGYRNVATRSVARRRPIRSTPLSADLGAGHFAGRCDTDYNRAPRCPTDWMTPLICRPAAAAIVSSAGGPTAAICSLSRGRHRACIIGNQLCHSNETRLKTEFVDGSK
jgi:hypothetical protein